MSKNNDKLSTIAHAITVVDPIQNCNANYIVEISGDLTAQDLRIGLKRIQEKYTVLQYKVVSKIGMLRWEKADWENNAINLKVYPEEEATKVCSLELDKAFGIGDYPLIRCNAFMGKESISKISITICHSVIDGIGGKGLIIDLLNFSQPELNEKLVALPAKMGNINKLFPKKHSGIRGKVIAAKMMLSAKKQKDQVSNYNPIIGSKRSIVSKTLKWDKDFSEKMLKRCREEGTTITGAVMAAYFSTMRAEFPQNEPIPLTTGVAVNLRDRLPTLDKDTIGMLNGTLNCTLH